ncbi:hypothetical protein LCGC14_1296260 [marine sediment metagenome]|uniref:Uncharacterized protein n=1 Tax=marine sediment metagenome TaxID=412755 RepID=A0A0F9N7G7_9ZZZZ
MAESVLKLSTLIDRPTIIIDDVSYGIRSPDELSVLDHYRLGSQGKKLDALMDEPELDDEGEKKLSTLLHAITDFIMVDVPADVRVKLSDAMRTEIAEVFTTLPLRKHLTALTKEITTTEAATRKAMADLPATEATAEE